MNISQFNVTEYKWFIRITLLKFMFALNISSKPVSLLLQIVKEKSLPSNFLSDVTSVTSSVMLLNCLQHTVYHTIYHINLWSLRMETQVKIWWSTHQGLFCLYMIGHYSSGFKFFGISHFTQTSEILSEWQFNWQLLYYPFNLQNIRGQKKFKHGLPPFPTVQFDRTSSDKRRRRGQRRDLVNGHLRHN